MSKQPNCVYCGKKIAKKTFSVWFWNEDNAPRTLEEAKSRTNQQVTSHRWYDHHKQGRIIASINTWDGESYVDPFFCNGTCAKEFAYAAARTGMKMGGKA